MAVSCHRNALAVPNRYGSRRGGGGVGGDCVGGDAGRTIRGRGVGSIFMSEGIPIEGTSDGIFAEMDGLVNGLIERGSISGRGNILGGRGVGASYLGILGFGTS